MPQRPTRTEFRQWAATQKPRYERVAGEPVARSPERTVHIPLEYRMRAALDRAIRSSGLTCEVTGDGITVEIDDDTDYEPDALVNCGSPNDPNAVVASNPVVVVQVLSPSTQSIDTTDKLADYFRVPSIQRYPIVRTVRREIVHRFRFGDGIATRIVNIGTIQLDPPGIALDIDEVYTRTI
jgi:Uma2 family endonuclease